MIRSKHAAAIVAVLFVLTGTGCVMDNYQNRGAAFGTLSGAAVGTAIGAHNDNTLLGTAVGALAGAAVGSAVGSNIDSDIAQVQYQQGVNNEAFMQNALSQVVQMSQQQVGEEIIINHVRSTGLPRSPNANEIVQLKQAGVSDRVITTLQATALPVQVAAPIRAQPVPVVVEEYHRWGPPAYCPPPRYRGFPARRGVSWGFSYHR